MTQSLGGPYGASPSESYYVDYRLGNSVSNNHTNPRINKSAFTSNQERITGRGSIESSARR